jgi:S-(hydroxymethyl)glutathione dehydrogenase/alcohol dehydrogenase
MKTRAALLAGTGKDWEIAELDLDPPKVGEVLVKYMASGLCHTDEHFRAGDLVPRFPVVGGHEGAGIVEEVGPGVTHLSPGDHIVTPFIPACGKCRYCATGRQALCDRGATLLEGCLVDGSFRFHRDGEDVAQTFGVGTFAQHAVVSQDNCVVIDDDVSFEAACLVGCGVPTGWGSAVASAGVRPGDTVVIYGTGGVGINAVQGARFAGARNVVAIDPLPNKREAAEELGATHSAANHAEAAALVTDLTRGQMADKAIITVGLADSEVVTNAFDIVGKDGVVVLTAVSSPTMTINIPGILLTLFQKTIKGCLYGAMSPNVAVKEMIALYQSGDLKLDELITKRYQLDEINQAYQDLLDGKNMRGVIVHEH